MCNGSDMTLFNAETRFSSHFGGKITIFKVHTAPFGIVEGINFYSITCNIWKSLNSLVCQSQQKSGMLWILPVITAIWIFAAFLITYGIAVNKGHVDAFLPYISYTAIEEPQKSVFSQLVNVGAMLLGCNAYIRFLQIKACYTDISQKERRLNMAGLILGLLSALGLSMVANFQARILKIPHYSGAFLAFGIGTVYCWLQSILTRKEKYPCIQRTRLIISILVSVVLFVFICTVIIYKLNKFPGSKYTVHREVYLTSTITEWLLALMILIYILTFIPEFRKMTLRFPAMRRCVDPNTCNHETEVQHLNERV